LLGRDLLVVNRIVKAAADMRAPIASYPGDEIGESVIRWEKMPGNKIALKTISYKERSCDSSENGLYRSLQNSNFPSIQAAFPVKAFSKDSSGTVIEVTDF